MAKKAIKENDVEDIVEDIALDDDTDIIEPKPIKKAAAKINIMDTVDSNEPPKKTKEKSDAPLDLGPILEKLDKGFTELQSSLKVQTTQPKKQSSKDEPSDDHLGFLSPLGDW